MPQDEIWGFSGIITNFVSSIALILMADNYLEKRMEEHRAGRDRVAVRSTASRAGCLQPGIHLQYPPMRVVVFAANAAEASPFVETLRGAGLSVALCCTYGGKAAVEMSQRHGARLYPDGSAPEGVVADFCRIGNLPMWVVDLCGAVEVGKSRILLSEQAKTEAPGVLARMLLFMIHPEHGSLLANQSIFEVY